MSTKKREVQSAVEVFQGDPDPVSGIKKGMFEEVTV